MPWKTDFRSLYYVGAPEPDDLDLPFAETALLVIDVQNTYLVSSALTARHCRPSSNAATTPGRHSTNACESQSFPASRKC